MPKLFPYPQVLMWFFDDISIHVLQLRNTKENFLGNLIKI